METTTFEGVDELSKERAWTAALSNWVEPVPKTIYFPSATAFPAIECNLRMLFSSSCEVNVWSPNE